MAVHEHPSAVRERRGEDGASAVEFALVLVLLVTLLVGISQFGILFSQWLEMEHAAREGARWGALQHIGGTVNDPNTVRGKVAGAASGLRPALTTADIDVTPENPTGLARSPMTVTIRHKSPVLPLMGTFLGTSGPTLQLEATAVQMIE